MRSLKNCKPEEGAHHFFSLLSNKEILKWGALLHQTKQNCTCEQLHNAQKSFKSPEDLMTEVLSIKLPKNESFVECTRDLSPRHLCTFVEVFLRRAFLSRLIVCLEIDVAQDLSVEQLDDIKNYVTDTENIPLALLDGINLDPELIYGYVVYLPNSVIDVSFGELIYQSIQKDVYKVYES